ncbi:hypothetical protein EAG_08495, partial [Camponotus floridanus]
SKSLPHLGAAFYSPDIPIQKKYKLDRYFSIFSAECIAIMCAMDYILEEGIKRSAIFTDSRSMVETLSNGLLDRDLSYLILALKNKLRSAYVQNLDVVIVWVPSHVGILGNETADLLAGEAARQEESVDYLPPHTDLYSLVKEKYFSDIEKYLLAQSEIRGAQYFSLYPPFARKPWFAGLDLSRAEITTICRIRSNHYNLNFSLYRCGLVRRPDCLCGLPYQDINHVLWSCPMFACHRVRLLQLLRR